jgi:hypothetical protein
LDAAIIVAIIALVASVVTAAISIYVLASRFDTRSQQRRPVGTGWYVRFDRKGSFSCLTSLAFPCLTW